MLIGKKLNKSIGSKFQIGKIFKKQNKKIRIQYIFNVSRHKLWQLI